MSHCELCDYDRNQALWKNDRFFVIAVDDEQYPGYVRIIWNDHKAEMTDLDGKDLEIMLKSMAIIEKCMREVMKPHKVNWAQFGNMVPHLHWHAIPRYPDDMHFPQSIWGVQQRQCPTDILAKRRELAGHMHKAIVDELNRSF
ncbi:MAG: HIT family protein [Burkholderiaceae bacterium]|nr:HIT family protein [Burkholderiaceae bacterium]